MELLHVMKDAIVQLCTIVAETRIAVALVFNEVLQMNIQPTRVHR
jgi:hypothetical protein